MISLFKQRKPRPYHHQPIYSDERKERLKAMEERAKIDLGMASPREITPEDFRGAFSRQGVQRKNSASLLGSMPTVIMAVLLAFLFLLMLYLMN